MTILKQTTTVHVTAVKAQAGKPNTAVVIAPAAADIVKLTQNVASGLVASFVDASGNLLVAWPDQQLQFTDWEAAWELKPYINNIYNQISIIGGNWQNTRISAGPMTPQAYLAKYGTLMTP